LTALAIGFVCTAAGQSQTADCLDESGGQVVRSVTVKARWLSTLKLPLKKGDILTPAKLKETRNAVRAAINAEKDKFDAEAINLGKLPLVDANLERTCVQKVPEATCLADGLAGNCVDVAIRPYALSTDPLFMGSILLPMPRSNKFTFLGKVPKPLRLLNPKFGLGSDRELGVSPSFEISSDLLSVGDVLGEEPAKTRPITLMFHAAGSRSLTKSFYTSHVELSLLARQPNKHIESAALETSFAAEQQPQKDLVFRKNSLRVGGHLTFNPTFGVVNRVNLSGAYRRSRNYLSGDGTRPPIVTSENAYEGRALLEGRVFDGFTRVGLWVDGGKSTSATKSYSRQVALAGYNKEVVVGEHTIGIEALFGAGRASANTPSYALFYGGNSSRDFLYEDNDESSLVSLPAGPLLRSFGKNQAGVAVPVGPQLGGNRFQHLNLTISVPLPGLSTPLIPNEIVSEDPRLMLRDLVEFAVNSGQESLSLSLQDDDGLSEEEADKKAAKIFGEIRPGVKYLTNHAKLYALKPLLMFDAARLARFGTGGYQTRYAVGGGLQLTVVVAKFEGGYLRTLNSVPGDQRGTVLFRLVFQNLF
jgi:hypothetical protein